MTLELLALAVLVLGYCLVAKRLSSTVLTAPMLFLGMGYLLSRTGGMPESEAEAALHIVAEVALIILLFLDAAQVDLAALRRQHAWPVRMLALGLPLTLIIGTTVARPFLSDWPLVAVALVAAVLAPTDAALGQAVLTNPRVPHRSRLSLTVESGLNDGFALPAVLLFASLTAEAMDRDGTNWVLFGLQQLTLGPLVGVVAGHLGGLVLLAAKDRAWTSETFEGVGSIALASACYLASTAIGGNGFIAAFVGGLAFGNVVKGRCKFVYEFTESDGQMLSWAAFLMIGMVLLPDALHRLTLSMLAIILSSLFVVRPLAVWISLIGSDASTPTRLFFGWFGPRGLATALFALLVVKRIDPVFGDQILALAVNAVWISALLHGMTAAAGANWYARRIRAMDESAEMKSVDRPAKPPSGMRDR